MKLLAIRDYYIQHRRSTWMILGLAVLIVIAAIILPPRFGGKQQANTPNKQPAVVPVNAATVAVENVPLQVTAIGAVEAYSTVSVKSEVEGQITKVFFKEGDYVKKGDPLFTIDPRPAQANYQQSAANLSKSVAQQRQAEANLIKDQAQARTAAAQAQRYAGLYDQGIISKDQYEQVRTNAEALAAVVKADEAAIATARESVGAAKAVVEGAKVQLSYSSIRSPIDGRTGTLMINQGNIVRANDTNPLVVINQVNPIYVTFSVPESQLADIKRYSSQGMLPVQAVIPQDSGTPEQGTLNFIDNTVDRATGTVKLKATFANDARRLWPGQFVNVTMTLTTENNATVVPTQAVQTGQQGQYVFVVKPDQTVESRAVTVSRTTNNVAIITNGLTAGETVVTDGQLRLRPGSKVQITEDNKSATDTNRNQ